MPARGPPYGPGCKNPPRAKDSFAAIGTAPRKVAKHSRRYYVKAWAVDERDYGPGKGSSSCRADPDSFALHLDDYKAVRKLHALARKLGGR